MTTDELVGIVKQLIEEGGGGGGATTSANITLSNSALESISGTALKQNEANIEFVEKINSKADSQNAYEYLYQVGNIDTSYLAYASYIALDYANAKRYYDSGELTNFLFGCSTFTRLGLMARNYDWLYSLMCGFVVRTPAINNRHAVLGMVGQVDGLTKDVVKSGAYSEMYKIVPFALTDGVNDAGLKVSINVVPNDKGNTTDTNPGKEQVNALMFVRWALDNCGSVAEVEQALQNDISLYVPQGLRDMGYEVHFMVADNTTTKVLEFVNNVCVWTTHDKMTNFFISGVNFKTDGTVPVVGDSDIDTYGLSLHAEGLERYNILVNGGSSTPQALLESLKYTNLYTLSTNQWYSEFAGENDLDITSPISSYEPIMATARQNYATRDRESKNTAQSVHSVIYDTDKLTVFTQENYDTPFIFDLPKLLGGTGGGGVEYVDTLPATGNENTLYILSGGNKARNILKDRGTSGPKRYWKCRPGVSVSYDEGKNAYLATLGPEQFYIPLGLASMDLLVEAGAFSEVTETDPYDLVSYGTSSGAKFNNEQGLMLMPDMDKDNLPANTYLKATGTEAITYDVNTNTFLRDGGTWSYDLVYGTGMNNSILFLLRQSIMEVVEDESEAELIVETNKLSAVDTTDSICVNVLGNVAFGGLYIYKDGAWVELIAPNDIKLKDASGNAVQNRVVNKIVREIQDTTYPYMTTSYNTIDIDGYLVPVMEPYMFSDFLGIFDSAKCCILKCFEGTNAITLSILSTYKGNGIEELYLDYPGVGVIKYYRSTTEIENIHTILIKYADKPQQIGVSGTSGSLTDEQYLELQTTNAQIKLADDDNMLLSKCIDNGTTFSYSGMQVNSSSQVIGYTIVVSADKSWVKYKKTLG